MMDHKLFIALFLILCISSLIKSETICEEKIKDCIQEANKSWDVDENMGDDDISVKQRCCSFWQLIKCAETKKQFCETSEYQKLKEQFEREMILLENGFCHQYSFDSFKCDLRWESILGFVFIATTIIILILYFSCLHLITK